MLNRDESYVLVILFNSLKGGNEKKVKEIADSCSKQKREYFRNILETIKPNYANSEPEFLKRLDRAIQFLS